MVFVGALTVSGEVQSSQSGCLIVLVTVNMSSAHPVTPNQSRRDQGNRMENVLCQLAAIT